VRTENSIDLGHFSLVIYCKPAREQEKKKKKKPKKKKKKQERNPTPKKEKKKKQKNQHRKKKKKKHKTGKRVSSLNWIFSVVFGNDPTTYKKHKNGRKSFRSVKKKSAASKPCLRSLSGQAASSNRCRPG